MKNLLIGLIISAVFVFFLASKFDKQEFIRLWENSNGYYLIPVLLCQYIGITVYSFRWKFLLENKLPLFSAISSSFIGYAGNAVLPARGGDLFRLYLAKKDVGLDYIHSLSKLFIEKVLDFIVAVLMGALSFLLIGSQSMTGFNFSLLIVLNLIVVGLIVFLILLRFANESINRLLHFLFSLIRLEKLYKHRLEPNLLNLKDFLTFKKISIPGALSVVSATFYVSMYFFVGKMLGLELKIIEAMFLMFSGAMSLAVPSAPSGIGVFHASLMSGFILLSRSDKEGLVFATLLHLISNLSVAIIGLIFYLHWSMKRSKI